MRGNVVDMLPPGWELAPSQSLAGVHPDLLLQRERDFFECVDGAVYSKDFAMKAQAMRTVSLGQVGILDLAGVWWLIRRKKRVPEIIEE